MKAQRQTIFTEENIQALFGHEAAESEDIERLRQYYFKGETYTRVTAKLPLRILVGQKGIGKSALFSVAQAEDNDAGEASLLVRPDDIAGVVVAGADFNKRIADWKAGIFRVVQKMLYQRMGMQDEEPSELVNRSSRFLSVVKDVARPFISKYVDVDPAERAFAERFLNTNRLTIYIDDLDRGWQGRLEDITSVSALLSALRDLSSNTESGLRFRVALRSDVYFAVRTSDESTDKFESSVVWQRWNNHEILAVLVKRILTYFNEPFDEDELIKTKQSVLANYLKKVMTEVFRGQGKWENAQIHRVLMTMVRQRPRDLVKLCTLAARRAAAGDRSLIMTEDWRSVFEEYSQGRIQDAINEHRSELPDIERLLLGMRPNKKTHIAAESYLYKTDRLLAKLQSIAEQGAFTFANNKPASLKQLAGFLYKIDFLIARKDTAGVIERRYFEQQRYLSPDFRDFGYDWEVHPAYRWALQPDTIAKLYEEIGLTSDED